MDELEVAGEAASSFFKFYWWGIAMPGEELLKMSRLRILFFLRRP